MPVQINNWSVTPPGLWRYRVPETGHWVRDFYAYNDLEDALRQYYKANALSMPSDVRNRVQEQMCEQLPPGWCKVEGAGVIGYVRGLLHEFQRVLQGTTTLADWWINGGKQRVSNEEVVRRSAICQKCIFNQPPVGCSACNIAALNRAVESTLGGDRLPTDAQLESCSICGCNLRVKTRIPLDILQRHINDQQRQQFPPQHNGFSGCWLREETNVS